MENNERIIWEVSLHQPDYLSASGLLVVSSRDILGHPVNVYEVSYRQSDRQLMYVENKCTLFFNIQSLLHQNIELYLSD